MRTITGDKTADFLLRQIQFLRRVGDAEHKRDADKWEQVIRTHAEPAEPAMAANFATTRDQKPEGAE